MHYGAVGEFSFHRGTEGCLHRSVFFQQTTSLTFSVRYGRTLWVVKNEDLAFRDMHAKSVEEQVRIELPALASMKDLCFTICEMRDNLVLLQLTGQKQLFEPPTARPISALSGAGFVLPTVRKTAEVASYEAFTQMICFQIGGKRVGLKWSSDCKERYQKLEPQRCYFPESNRFVQYGETQKQVYTVKQSSPSSPQSILIRDWDRGHVKGTIECLPVREVVSCEEVGSDNVLFITSKEAGTKIFHELYVKKEAKYERHCAFELLCRQSAHNRFLVQSEKEGIYVIEINEEAPFVVQSRKCVLEPSIGCSYQLTATKLARYGKHNGIFLLDLESKDGLLQNIYMPKGFKETVVDYFLYDDFLVYVVEESSSEQPIRKTYLVDCKTAKLLAEVKNQKEYQAIYIGREGDLFFFYDGFRVCSYNNRFKEEKCLFWADSCPVYKEGLFTYISHADGSPSYEIRNFRQEHVQQTDSGKRGYALIP